jgi:hypothetical protein
VWDLPNGRVQFGHPLYLDGMTMPSGEIVRSDPSSPSSPIALWDPTFLGRYETTTKYYMYWYDNIDFGGRTYIT